VRGSITLPVAFRQIWSRSHSGVVRMVSSLSIAGIAIGVAALLLLDSFMNGFQGAIMDFLSDANPPVVVTAPGGGALSGRDVVLVERLASSIPGLGRVSPYLEKAAVVSGNGGSVAGIVLRAVDPAAEAPVSSLSQSLPAGGREAVIGSDLAVRLRVAVGDSMRIASTETIDVTAAGRALVDTIVGVRIAGVRDFGLAEYNSGLAVVTLETASAVFGADGGYSAAGVELDRDADPVSTSSALSEALRSEYVDSRHDRYMEAEAFLARHENLFRAFGLERFGMTLVLALITVVALLNLSSALAMIALEHRRDTGVLRAMGAGPGTIFRVALTQGLLLGVSGCAAGTLFASAAIFLVNRVIPFRLEDSVYWVDTLVARIDPGTWVVIAGGTLAACLAASLVPAAGAVAVPPAECVRHE
jgi:lipoprotein-releasing system permease protein